MRCVSSLHRRSAVCASHENGPPMGKPSPRGSFDMPKRLLGTSTRENATMYTVRICTGVQRGSALREPSAGVLICLVGEDGNTLLHRLAPLADPSETQAHVRDICGDDTAADPSSDAVPGIDCSLARREAALQAAAPARLPPRRFQEGAVDEICFRGPELGPLAALIVGPEAGSWRCDEVDVSSSRSGSTARFVCRDDLGEGGSSRGGSGPRPAAYLRPVPPGGVVYGSGDAAVVLSREQAAQLHTWNMEQYSDLKGALMATTAALVAVGTAVTAAICGGELAWPFALGGASSLAYQYLLQRRVDKLGQGATPAAVMPAATPLQPKPAEVQPGPGLHAALVLSNPAVRAALMAGGLLGSLAIVHFVGSPLGGLTGAGEQLEEAIGVVSSTVDGAVGAGQPAAMGGLHVSGPVAAEVRQVAAGLAGFLVQKVAVVWVASNGGRVPEAPRAGRERGAGDKAERERQD